MNYKIITSIEQGSKEWLSFKTNSIGGTSAYTLLKYGKEKAYAQAKTGALNSLKYSGPISKAAKWGTDHEPEARNLLWKMLMKEGLTNGLKLREVGMLVPVNYENVHYSPDGLIVDEKDEDCIKQLIEIKCYGMPHHLQVIKNNSPDDSVIAQIQFGLWISQAEFCYYCGYNPLMLDETLTPDHKRHPEKVLYIQKIYPDSNYFKAFEKSLK